MNKLTIAKFGGSAIGVDGEGIPEIVKRIKEIQKNSKLVVVCSAPLTMIDEKKKSLTDVILGIGKNVVDGNNIDFSVVEKPYLKILDYVNDDTKDLCKGIIDDFLKKIKEFNKRSIFQKRIFRWDSFKSTGIFWRGVNVTRIRFNFKK